MKALTASLVFLVGLLALCSTAHASPDGGWRFYSFDNLTPRHEAVFSGTLLAGQATTFDVKTDGAIKCTVYDGLGNPVAQQYSSMGKCHLQATPTEKAPYSLVVINLSDYPKAILSVWR